MPRSSDREPEQGLTFDDILLVPAYSDVLPKETDISTKLTRNITLGIPLVSAAMDTVSEAPLAIALAQEGGIGVIHRNMTVEQQSRHVEKVKKYESGMIADPVTVSPEQSVEEVLALIDKRKISGVPVVKGKKLVGIVTNRDLRFETRRDIPIADVMTPKKELVTVEKGAKQSQVQKLLHKHRIEKVPVVNKKFELCGLITFKDFQKTEDFPNACRDKYGRLLVAAAIGVGAGEKERIEALLENDVDLLCIDTAHGHTKLVLDTLDTIKKKHKGVQVIVGNVVTADGARALVDHGADAVKVGVGPGSICTTRVIAGVGMPQVTAIMNVAHGLKGKDVPLIADGGIRYSGDIAKAIAVGADAVMVGGLFAGTIEAPGQVDTYQGRSYKSYRGMGSLGAMSAGSSSRYYQDKTSTDKMVPEGIEASVPYRGHVADVVAQLTGGLRSSMGYLGCRRLDGMRKSSFIRVTSAGVSEGHVHDVTIVKEAPNYRIN